MSDYVVVAETLIDGTGAQPRHDVGVHIRDGRILDIVDADEVQHSETRVIDAGTRTLAPGLWNCHVHLALQHPFPEYRTDVEPVAYLTMRCYRQALRALRAGFTSLRTVGEAKRVDLQIKKAIDRGLVDGPNIFGAGEAIIPTGGHGFNSLSCAEADGPEGFARAARMQLREGADLVKMCISGGLGSPHESISASQATREEMRACVEIAGKADKHVAVHASAPVPIREAVECGVNCVEHAYELDDATIENMIASDTYLCPTLLVTNCGDYLERHGAPSWQLEKQKEAAVTHFSGFERAVEAGIPILSGTDLLPTDEVDGTWAGLREIELLVEGGMTPMAALQAATSNPARLCGAADHLGTLTPGKQADLVAFGENPLEDISAVRGVELVMKQGRVIRQSF